MRSKTVTIKVTIKAWEGIDVNSDWVRLLFETVKHVIKHVIATNFHNQVEKVVMQRTKDRPYGR